MTRTRIVWTAEERDSLIREVVFQANTSKETSLIKLINIAQQSVLPFDRQRKITGKHQLGTMLADFQAALLKPGSIHQAELDKDPSQTLADYQNSIIDWIVNLWIHKFGNQAQRPQLVYEKLTYGVVCGLWNAATQDIQKPANPDWTTYPDQYAYRLTRYIAYLILHREKSALTQPITVAEPQMEESPVQNPVLCTEHSDTSVISEIDTLVEKIVDEHFQSKIDSLVTTIIDRVKIRIQSEVERRARDEVKKLDAEVVQFPQISVNNVKSEKKPQQRVILLGMKQVKDHFDTKEYPRLDLVFAQELNEVRRVANSDAIIVRAVRFSSQIPKDLQNKVQRVVDVPGGASAVKHQLWAINNAEKGEQ